VFFAWTVALRKILIFDNLRKMNVILVDWCCMCKKSRESIDHLFLHCDVARELWRSLSLSFPLKNLSKKNYGGRFSSCLGLHGLCLEMWESYWWSGGNNWDTVMIWKCGGWLICIWCIWRESDAGSFEDRETARLELKKMLFHSLYTWIVAFTRLSTSNFSEFL
jgi:hypothetical protein